MIPLSLLVLSAAAADLEFGYVSTPTPDDPPALLVTPNRAVAFFVVRCEAGGRSWDWETDAVSGGDTQRFSWDADSAVTQADCNVRVKFADGMVREHQIPIEYSYATPLSVDLSSASADLEENALSVSVTARVDRAEVVAWGARKAELSRQTVQIGAGPGEISVPWQGDASEVVLLDVTLHSGGSWAGFTFSPWFMDIPHEDVLFATDAATIDSSEAHKLEATLRELQSVLDQYGEVVPVQLFIAGCTDTVGDAASNQSLSRRRAQAIASWFRAHGYSQPIFYYGFGEDWLAVPTGDGVDEQANRRALYLMGASPPPPSSGVPQVNWIPL